MFGKRDAVINHLSNFWIDYIEIPGTSYSDSPVRYSYRMQEQENIWESFHLILQRLRIYCDNPFVALPNGAGPEDESQLYALREGLVNLCAHADYFSPMHPTIRVYTNRIEFQNPGRFMFPIEEIRTQIHSMPRNPSIIKFFRYAKLGENAGYGIDKMLTWEKLTDQPVNFHSDLVCSTVTYWFNGQSGGQVSGQVSGQIQTLLNVIRDGVLSASEILKLAGLESRRYVREKMLGPAIEQGFVLMSYPDRPNHPKQKYYLSEKGLRMVKK